MSMLYNYYSKFYTEKNMGGIADYSEILDPSTIPQLDERARNKLEQNITLIELQASLKDLKKGKTPGCDGLRVEFYIIFWENIKELVYESILFAMEVGHFSLEQRRGVIILIPKKDTNKHLLKNWRPITLLNVDYKILTKLLARRLSSYMSKLIYTDQTGYIKGRYIGTDIRTIEDVIDFTNATDSQGYLLAVDFHKAFDSINWSSILNALRLYGFGDYFINWVQLIYMRF